MTNIFADAAVEGFPLTNGLLTNEFMSAKHHCQALLHRYAVAQDSGNALDFSRLFAAGAVWKRPGREPLVGRPAIYEHARVIFADHGKRTKIAHFVTNFDFRLEGSRAFSRCYAFFHRHGGGDGAPVAFGSLIYLDEYRFEDAWLIQEHEASYIVP